MKSIKLLFAVSILIISALSFNIYSQYNQQTLCRNGLNVPIIDNSSVKDSIFINITNGYYLYDVNLRIDTLIHTWDGDLDIYIRKGNIERHVINELGGSGDNFIGTMLNDSATIPIASGTPPFTGTYLPYQPLSSFIGFNIANGYWIITVTDNASGDTGFLKAWCLILIADGITGGIQTIEIPNSYRLYQNYPNPFNPVTKIKYGLPKNSYIKLIVYDELGKEVDIVDEGYKEANTYDAVFDATNLPSGVYYYKFESDGFSDTKKMVIVK